MKCRTSKQGATDMSMSDSAQHSHDELTLAQEVTVLVDRFAEYNCISAFLNKSFTAVMSANEPMKPAVIEGAKHCAESLEAKAQELKAALDHIHEMCKADEASSFEHRNQN